MLLPEPVGATRSRSRPASAAATISPWPGRNAARPKTSWRTASAASLGAAITLTPSPALRVRAPSSQGRVAGRLGPFADRRSVHSDVECGRFVAASVGADGHVRVGAGDPRQRGDPLGDQGGPVSYTHLRAHETGRNLVCRLLLEKKKKTKTKKK